MHFSPISLMAPPAFGSVSAGVIDSDRVIILLVFGLRVAPTAKWRHLVVMALETVVLTLLVNALFVQQLNLLSPAAVLFAVIQTFAAMEAGWRGGARAAQSADEASAQRGVSHPFSSLAQLPARAR